MDLQNSTGAAVFDASQYEFFGNDAVDKVELGGLEEEDDFHPVGFEDEDFQLEREELNKIVNAPSAAGFIGSRGSGESSSAVEWGQRPVFSNGVDHQVNNLDSNNNTQDSNTWSSHLLHSSDPNYLDPTFLHHASSYPEPHQQHQYPHQQFFSEPILVPKTSLSSYPRFPFSPGGSQMHVSSPYPSPLSKHQSQYNTPNHTGKILPHNQWAGQANMSPFERSNSYNNWLQLQQRIPRPNVLMNPQLMQDRPNHPFPQPYGHLSGTHFSPPQPMMNNVETALGWGDLRDQRTTSSSKIGQGHRYPQQQFDSRSGWPQFRSKYMSSNEIENILRMQLAATHSNDPYVDDYYHQARLTKKSSGAKSKHNFCPHYLRDLPPHARANSEPHKHLQVEALGRVAFPSIRRPRPLLEVDPPKFSISAGNILSEKPLEQEPLLAARVMIEDGLCLLLDVDDIDRYLQFNPLQDGGVHLKKRRQVLLDELAALLHLIDPLAVNGQSVDLVNDLVFLRVVSLPKGKKLLTKYLQLLVPDSELARVICMAIFRHLRFFFGNRGSDSRIVESVNNLVKSILFCVGKMELKALSSCLASVVCASERPPLRPIGSPAGDEASVILKSILERATELFTNPSEDGNCSGPNRGFWQASFDSFFELLTKDCFGKYDNVIQFLIMQAPSVDMAVIEVEAARAVSKEMPVELLRASLPHIDENQRRVLMEFSQRSMPVNGDA